MKIASVLLQLSKISNDLDQHGLIAEANVLDDCVVKLAQLEKRVKITPQEVLALPNAAQIVKEARDWAMQCAFEDSEEIPEYSDFRILRGIDLNYFGGLEQFLKDNFVV